MIERVRRAEQNAMEAAAERMGAVSRRLSDGEITVQGWHDGMRDAIKKLHTSATALGRGGWSKVSQAEWGHAGQAIKAQYQYLARFSAQLANGEQPMDGRFVVRAAMYAGAAHATQEASRRRQETENGMEEERRMLSGTGESCSGCEEQAAMDWQPIGTLAPIGDEECMVLCRCEFEYRMMPEVGV